MNDTTMESRYRINPFKVVTQWVLLPAITGLLGFTGTSLTWVKELRETQIVQGKDIAATALALATERDDRKFATEENNKLLQRVISLDTEVITLFRVQQQAKSQ